MLRINNLNEIPHFACLAVRLVRKDNNSFYQVGEKVRPPLAAAPSLPNISQKPCHSEPCLPKQQYRQGSEESKIAEKLFCATIVTKYD